LVPYNLAEGISLKEAVALSCKSESTVRNWCGQYGIGRRVGNGTWVVSQDAFARFLDGDKAALAASHAGDQSGDLVLRYFDRFDLRRGASLQSLK
jgi:hypothetical protein